MKSSNLKQPEPYDLSFQIRHDWFTPEAWKQHILPLCRTMTNEGGAVCVMLQVDPLSRNFTLATAHAFDREERKVLRQAVERCRARKAKALA
jgi:hypothetical protein